MFGRGISESMSPRSAILGKAAKRIICVMRRSFWPLRVKDGPKYFLKECGLIFRCTVGLGDIICMMSPQVCEHLPTFLFSDEPDQKSGHEIRRQCHKNNRNDEGGLLARVIQLE